MSSIVVHVLNHGHCIVQCNVCTPVHLTWNLVSVTPEGRRVSISGPIQIVISMFGQSNLNYSNFWCNQSLHMQRSNSWGGGLKTSHWKVFGKGTRAHMVIYIQYMENGLTFMSCKNTDTCFSCFKDSYVKASSSTI